MNTHTRAGEPSLLGLVPMAAILVALPLALAAYFRELANS